MKFIADFHIHSHFSRATSKKLAPEYLDFYAIEKGISVIGTGDFTHPGWLNELKKKTVDHKNGLLGLKSEYKISAEFEGNTQFLLTAEISNIYKKNGKVRKVHNVVLVPDFEEAEKINRRLLNLGGNLSSDGRPILGLDSRDLLEIVLECGENNYFFPAHIWTPWFSMLGSKSGFDSIFECFGDLTNHIHTIETGLSTDPPMNWLCSFLDKVTLVSNSDAHSPDKLGRNANVFNTDPDYFSIIEALKTGDVNKFLGTIDMYPQEGKYHYDGHRKCNVCWDPVKTIQNNELCPVCKKPLTVGVMNRVIQLSDRENLFDRKIRHPFHSIIPLKEILSEIYEAGVNAKKTEAEYQKAIEKLGNELDILLQVPLHEIEKKAGAVLAEAIRRMRNREIIVKEGFDGEFGVIKVFNPGEKKQFETTGSLFSIPEIESPQKRDLINFDLKGIQKIIQQKKELENMLSEKEIEYSIKPVSSNFNSLNDQQIEAVRYSGNHSVILAGPGTGKTKTLTSKIAWLIGNKKTSEENILAITFTNKAANELTERVEKLLKKSPGNKPVNIFTFHGFGLDLLKNYAHKFNRTQPFLIIDDQLKFEIIAQHFNFEKKKIRELSRQFSSIKQKQETPTSEFEIYENALRSLNAFDFDDLISKPLQLLENNIEISKEIKTRYSHIFIDEFQDTNFIQFKLIQKLISDNSAEVCLVGDENQSIYGFRGASPDFIAQFLNQFPNAKIFALTRSYRCSQTILSASAEIINKDPEYLKGINEGVKISLSEQSSDAAEAEFIARQIVDLVGGVNFFSIDSSVTKGEKSSEISSLSDFAILCRTKAQFPAIAKALTDHHIPFQEIGTEAFYHKKPFTNFIALLNAGFAENVNLANKILSLYKITLSELQFIENINARNTLSTENYLNFVKNTFLKQVVFEEKEWEKFIWIAQNFNNLHAFIEHLQLSSGVDNLDKKLEAVSLMTLHAAKGLEFECVFIPACEQGIIPYSLYKDEVDEEEEKRLLYVGMTRAKSLLYLTNAKKRIFRGRTFQLPKSNFLNRIEKELIEYLQNKRQQKTIEKDNQLSLF